jgi:hypothetical protein
MELWVYQFHPATNHGQRWPMPRLTTLRLQLWASYRGLQMAQSQMGLLRHSSLRPEDASLLKVQVYYLAAPTWIGLGTTTKDADIRDATIRKGDHKVFSIIPLR